MTQMPPLGQMAEAVLRTADAASPLDAPAVAASLLAFVLVYFTVFGIGVWYILKLMGKRVGMTSTDGIVIDGRLMKRGDMSGPKSAQMVLQNPTVDTAVFEVARGGIQERPGICSIVWPTSCMWCCRRPRSFRRHGSPWSQAASAAA